MESNTVEIRTVTGNKFPMRFPWGDFYFCSLNVLNKSTPLSENERNKIRFISKLRVLGELYESFVDGIKRIAEQESNMVDHLVYLFKSIVVYLFLRVVNVPSFNQSI